MKLNYFRNTSIILFLMFVALVNNGCTKNTVEDCMSEASKAPTEEGVRLAAAACYGKYRSKSNNPNETQSNSENVDDILLKSPKCDPIKLEKLAEYIVINKEKKGQPDFEIVATEYKTIRSACTALGR